VVEETCGVLINYIKHGVQTMCEEYYRSGLRMVDRLSAAWTRYLELQSVNVDDVQGFHLRRDRSEVRLEEREGEMVSASEQYADEASVPEPSSHFSTSSRFVSLSVDLRTVCWRLYCS